MNPVYDQGVPPPAPTSPTKSYAIKNSRNIAFAVILILYEILALPIFGVLFRLSNSFTTIWDFGGVLLVSMTIILLIIGFGLINSYVVRSSFTGLTYTLLIFCLTIQHWYFFRAFWNKAGANDYDHSGKTWSTGYDKVTLSNYDVDRQVSTNLNSGAFVEGIACAISMAVAFNPVVGRIGLLQVFFLTLFGAFFYEVNAQLIFRWFITDNGFGSRIFTFGAIMGLFISLLLGKRETTLMHASYRSEYRIMAFGLLGFLFVVVSLPLLNTIGVYSNTIPNNAILYASNINAWLAIFASVLGTFTANSILYRKFSVHDLIFVGTAGAFACSMSFDITYNPCVPLIVGFVVSFASAIYPMTFNRKVNEKGVLFTYPHVNRFIIPALIASIVSAVIQASSDSANGAFGINRLSGRTAIQQGGWQLVGFLISAGIAILAGLLIGIICRLINGNTSQDQFNDQTTYDNVPNPYIQTD